MLVKTKLIPKGFDAVTVWPFIFVRPERAHNKPLIEHELVHYEEQREAKVVPWLLKYWLSEDFRIDAEVRAYKKQIEEGGITVLGAANMLLKYHTKLTSDEALLKFITKS